MNFLAHAYLSFGKPALLTGNLMADFIRGKPLPDLPEEIRQGIYLHRKIDDFTDHHPVNHEAYGFFKETAGRFAPVFLDIAYDYFLSNDTRYFADQAALDKFAEQTYQGVEQHLEHTGERFQEIFHHMRQRNWLAHYNQTQSIARSFHGITYRTKHITDTSPIFGAFMQHQNGLREAFGQFFPDLETHVKNMLFRDA